MMEMTLKFRKAKETKNTVMFEESPEPGKPPVVGRMYIQKWASPPDSIVVTIKEA